MDNRFARGFVWGVVATIAMSVFMLMGVSAGISPMPKPIPLAIVTQVMGAYECQTLMSGENGETLKAK